MFLKEVISFIFLSSAAVSVAVRQYGSCSSGVEIVQCYRRFRCREDGTCIDRKQYCDGTQDCNDNSDEANCFNGDAFRPFFSPNYYDDVNCGDGSYYECYDSTGRNRRRCIPREWKCDGVTDCPSGEDERSCESSTSVDDAPVLVAKQKAVQWLHNTSVPESTMRKWGPLVHKTAVAFYLSDTDLSIRRNSVWQAITYELTIQMLSRLAQKKIQDISSSDLASFINSFLVTCINPKDFHGFNLIEELRNRIEKRNSTNPYLFLALCNAGDTITESDVKKLRDIFWSNKRELWTDTQAVALMALSCARNQPDSSVGSDTVSELALELKNHQYRNGTVESLHSTLMVLQALYAAETDQDPDNFDEKKALAFVLQNQKTDGSFGNFLLTYAALPVLNCKSLVDISDSHCETVPKDEDTSVFDLMNHVGPKIRIRYSVWIGKERDIERTLSLRVPDSSSFYRVMEIAAEIDSRYKFEYVVKSRRPYIYAVSGIMDDSESGQFWFPYTVKDEVPTLLEKSTAEVILQDNDQIVMWYRKGSWLE